MENNQKIEQELPKTNTPTSDSTIAKSKHSPALDIFLRLIAYHPWLLVVGLLVTFAGSAYFAVRSLGYVENIEAQKTPTTEQPEVEAEIVEPISSLSVDNENPLPFWMILAIAMSCAGGSLFVFRWLNRSTIPQKKQKQVNRYQARLSQRQEPLEPNTFPQPRGLSEPRALKNPPVFVPPPTKRQFSSKPRKSKSMVTILPLQQNKQFNPRKESLADSLDIRKQGSASNFPRQS
ncbi:hypothetical protein [Brunnivagina elsteri]|uniref:Uncharacterized protein n=1 Tax=Brunnivagina elsteri CCALA 953 TaxID=987040 RepID=A0A2A2TGB1_9CYAN|nr:hypothetical protein [Calothrix elsteri]PAX52706.1 hypothetical protein CK510_17900 [Calothrix elsteri CCALA 953]